MAKRSAATTQARVPLSRERVLEAAIRLADEGGIESLTMRKLARELGVEAMSLYNHVANKGDLVDALVELVLEEIELPDDVDDWEAAIRACAISAHAAFLRHPWACSLAMGPASGTRTGHDARMRYMEWLLRRLREAGFSPELTYHAYHTLDSHILGFTLWQLGHGATARELADRDVAAVAASFLPQLRAGGFHYLAEHAEQHVVAPRDGGASEFEFGLGLILDGLARARRSRPRSRR